MKSLCFILVFLLNSLHLISSGMLTLNEYSLEWIQNEENIEFKFSTLVEDANNVWTSFAFSFDQQMGNDNALICKKYGSEQTVEQAFNPGKLKPILLSEQNPSIGLSNINAVVNDRNFTCSFSRKNFVQNIDNYFSTDTSYYLLFARGKTTNSGSINYHFTNKISSNEAFSLIYNKKQTEMTSFSNSLVTGEKEGPISLSSEETSRFTSTDTVESITTDMSKIGEYSNDMFSLKWENYDEKVNFVFTTKDIEKQSNVYSAFAFSKDDLMGDDDVIACKIGTNQIYKVERHYNQGKLTSPYLLDSNKQIGITEPKVNVSNGMLTCSFMIEKNYPNVTKYSDLTNKWYILFAFGDLGPSMSLTQHSIKKPGIKQINFTQTEQTTTTRANDLEPIGDVISTGSFNSNGYSLSWKNTENYIIFSGGIGGTLSKNNKFKRQANSPDSYVAFGLSDDKKMGNDCIIVCKIFNNIPTVEHHYSTGKTTPGYLKPDEPTIGIRDATVINENGNLFCNYTRKKTIEGTERYCDLKKNNYYLQIVKGSVSNNDIQNHGQSVVISDEKIDFKINGTFSGSKRDSTKAKAHACIMIFAWLFCVSTGIILARYYKYILPSVKIQKMMFWFHAHRALMIFAPICSIAAFLVILADLEWKWVEKINKVAFAHSIFGIVLIGLSLIQVLMGFIRPNKDAKIRPLFNVVHRFTGVSCLVLAVVACYLGVFIERMNLGNEGWGILVGWTLWVIILPLLIEIAQISCFKSKSESYELKDEQTEIKSKTNTKLIENIKTVLLFLHLVIALGHVIALMVIIGLAEAETEN